jgi:hypothetical protein
MQEDKSELSLKIYGVRMWTAFKWRRVEKNDGM